MIVHHAEGIVLKQPYQVRRFVLAPRSAALVGREVNIQGGGYESN